MRFSGPSPSPSSLCALHAVLLWWLERSGLGAGATAVAKFKPVKVRSSSWDGQDGMGAANQ